MRRWDARAGRLAPGLSDTSSPCPLGRAEGEGRRMIRSRYWSDLRWPEFRSLPAHTVAVLPVASTEQHGPHLPVSVDCTINRGLIERTLALIPADLPVLVLPMQAVALAVEHLRFPGTLTTSAETLIALVCDIGASVARAGCGGWSSSTAMVAMSPPSTSPPAASVLPTTCCA